MSSLRKRVSSYFRQLSFHNEPKDRKNNMNENSFVTKYLQGRVPFKEGPVVLYGKNPTDLPNYELGLYETGYESIVGCYTGPNGGLTTVKRTEKHLSVADPDIDYIDTQEEIAIIQTPQKSPIKNDSVPLDNTTMVIKVAGQEYYVTNRKKQHNKSHSLGSLSEFNIEIDKTKKYSSSTDDNNKNETNQGNVNLTQDNEQCKELCNDQSQTANETVSEIRENSENNFKENNVNMEAEDNSKSFGLAKSKSEGNPFNHKKRGKIIKLTERPRVDNDENDGSNFNVENDTLLPQEWNHKSNYVFGLSDSLYDKNQVTKHKNGDPIADCFGVIARNDSAILALADGVNWGEKACIAAKSAIHGCLHYLNKTIFNDTIPFQNLVKNLNDPPNFHNSNSSLTEHRINNTREVFVCLLRAFNCAHDLILENKGMLTTLTVAVVLPLSKSSVNKRQFEKYGRKSSVTQDLRTNSNDEDTHVCCVCNVGDTLAYVYSQTCGIRELTKGSHDISSNRDMRDALGALGPVDGINPELSNLTLSITTLKRGDIVLIASDGLTDNFDPNVCKFSTNIPESKKKPNTPNTQNQKENVTHNKTQTHFKSTDGGKKASFFQQEKCNQSGDSEKAKPPAKPPRKNIKSRDSSSRSSTEQSLSDRDSVERTNTKVDSQSCSTDNNNEILNNNKNDSSINEITDINNPLIAQFMQENSLDKPSSLENSPLASTEPKKNTLENKKKPITSHSNKQQASSSQQSRPRFNQQKSTHSMPVNRKIPPSKTVDLKSNTKKIETKNKSSPQKYTFLRSKTSLDMKTKPVLRNEEGIPFVNPIQRYELTLLLIEDILKRGISGNETQCVTSRKLCENLVSFTFSITSAKRHTLEDLDLYFDNRNGILIEVSAQEKKIRRRRGLEKVQNLPGKLDHVSVVACNVGNCS